MRVFKFNKSFIAFVVVVAGVVFSRSSVLLAVDPPPGPRPEIPVVRSETQNATDDASSSPPPSRGDALPFPMPPIQMPKGAPTQIPPPGEPQIGIDNSIPPPSPPRMPAPSEMGASPQAGPAGDPTRRMRQGPPPRGQQAMPSQGGRGISGGPAGGGGGGRARPRSNAVNETDIFKVIPQTCVPAKGQFIWNFEEEELINILRQVSDLSCRTMVVHDAINKNMKMTIIGKSPLTPKDAWDVLAASLAAKGLALVEQGKTWTVVKRNETKSYSTPMYFDGKQARNNEEVGTLFYKAQHASQESLKNVARLLISKDGMVESISDQFVIVIDSNSNIRRLSNIFAQIDLEDAINKVHVVTLDHADAKTVEKQLRDLFDISSGPSAGGAGGGRRRRFGPSESKTVLQIDKIIADERMNSLIVVADKDSVDKLKEVVVLMDQPSSDLANKGKIHVKKLRFADAKKIAETLNAVVQQGKSGRFVRRRPDDAASELFEGEVKITAHENTNTLVTVATPNDYRSLLATINKLDIRKEQVYVEAVILDISVNDKNEFGINLFSGLDPNWLGGNLGFVGNPGGKSMVEGLKTGLVAGAAGTNIQGAGQYGLGAMAVLGNFLSGGVGGVVGKPIDGTSIPSFGAVLQALSANSQVDVLSTPYLLTTDNQQAEMSVGEKIPVVRGASSVGGGGGLGAALGVPLQNIAYEDVKLTFKITPHVGADDNVRLEIEQEVNEVGNPEPILGQQQYRIRTKSAKTTLVLKDQQTGVIGGLIDHKQSRVDKKVPFLGDIPILGWLFKNRDSTNERRSLLLIITPYVIRTDDDYKKIVERKLKEREEFASLYYGGKIKNYNKHIDYDKKAGPLSSMLLQVDAEMNKVENGGPGDGSETVIAPKDNAPAMPSSTEPNSEFEPRITEETAELSEGVPIPEDYFLDEFGSGQPVEENYFPSDGIDLSLPPSRPETPPPGSE